MMITISSCMIVKNEENVLERALKGIAKISDEIIIIDTGSTDRTKEIALKYTDKVYDFQWVGDFSKARNFAFEKATMEYIYSADADEIIDDANIQRFITLKKAMLSDIEIVQMKYTNQLYLGTTYNYDTEYRPKLYKRIRKFIWQEPVHEAVRLFPVVYDSDIEIIHMPEQNHSERDFRIYKHMIDAGEILSEKLYLMYAKELYISGTDNDIIDAYEFFQNSLRSEIRSIKETKAAQCILVRYGRITNDINVLMSNSLKNIADGESSAEVCCELGEYFYALGDYLEAELWFYNAAHETSSELSIKSSGVTALSGLERCYTALGNSEKAIEYKKLADEWEYPVV